MSHDPARFCAAAVLSWLTVVTVLVLGHRTGPVAEPVIVVTMFYVVIGREYLRGRWESGL